MVGLVLAGRYRLLEKVGEGAMAVVYRAEDLLLGRTVALKLLRPEYAADPRRRAVFLQEARATARLVHPHVATVFDAGEAEGTPYLVMEFVEGVSLKTIIEQTAPLPVERALALASQILAALEAAHTHHLVHCDVKPQNVLVAAADQVKVVDFGIARALDGWPRPAAEPALGTPAYAAPEQFAGQAVGPAADLYAVGTILFEMLTGRLPFVAETPEDLARRKTTEEPPDPRRLNPAIPAPVAALVRRALALDPAARFASATAFRQAVEGLRALSTQQTVPLPVVAPERTGGLGSVLLFGLAGLAVLGMAVALALFFQLWLTGQTRLPRLSPPGAPAVLDTPTPTSVAPTPPPPSPTPTVTLPALVGQPLDQARELVQRLGLRLVVREERPDETRPAGVVLAQWPEPGQGLAVGEAVQVVVSSGPPLVTVPDLLRQPYDAARASLEGLGLRVEARFEFHESVPAGLVAAQAPGPGERVPPGSPVLLTISRGRSPTPTPVPPTPTPAPTPTPTPALAPDEVIVPDLIRLPEAEAMRRITASGLMTTYNNYQTVDQVAPEARAFFLSVPPGHVVSQIPAPGTRVKKGTRVHLAIRKE